MNARNLGPPGKRRGGPHQEAAHNVDTTTDRPMVPDTDVTTVEAVALLERILGAKVIDAIGGDSGGGDRRG